MTLSDCYAPHYLPILLELCGQDQPGSSGEAVPGRALAWRGGGKGKAFSVGLSRAFHQLSGAPFTAQPILAVGLDLSREGVGHGHLCRYDLGSEYYRSFYAFKVFPEAFHI